MSNTIKAQSLGYPEALRYLTYDPKFAIRYVPTAPHKITESFCRGLHYDMDRGNLLKLDFLGHVQACLFGRMAVPPEKIGSMYENRTILENSNLRIMHDIFCSPGIYNISLNLVNLITLTQRCACYLIPSSSLLTTIFASTQLRCTRMYRRVSPTCTRRVCCTRR